VLVGVVLAVSAGAVLASAALDAPSRTVGSTIVVEAGRAHVWDALLDEGGPEAASPTIVHVVGRVEVGESVELVVVRDGERDVREMEVLDVKKLRKLRLRDRLLAPGIRDRELTIRLQMDGRSRTHVHIEERVEGLAAPFYDAGADGDRFERMLEALEARLAPS
jgi:hypothetical protein